jgi:uncharacterized RDD family membrane protein YckC
MDTYDAVPPPLAAPPDRLAISGFWRRVLAFALDSLVLGIFGGLLGLGLFSFLASLGGWGRLIGFAVSLAYFGILNSSVGQGRTVGKRIMGIEVVDGTGGYLSLGRSFARYVILGVPLFLNGALLPMRLLRSPLGAMDAFLVFGIGMGSVYLLIFNTRTRQCVHDLAVGSFVVKGGGPGQPAAVSIWPTHLAIVGAWCAAVVGFSFFSPMLLRIGSFAELAATQQKLMSTGKVFAASVAAGKTWNHQNGVSQEISSLESTVIWKGRPADFEAAADQMASVILANYPDIGRKDVLIVNVNYGYDIGISSGWVKKNYRHSPQEWAGIVAPNN